MPLPPMNVYTGKASEWFEKIRHQWPLTAHASDMMALIQARKVPVEVTMESDGECSMEIDLPEGGSLEYVLLGDVWNCTHANPPSDAELYAMWEKQHTGMWPVWLNEPATVSGDTSHHRRASQLKVMAPGLQAVVQKPCSCNSPGMNLTDSVWQTIQHLNDTHHPANGCDDKWSRERIADWLDTLDVDLTVDPDRKPQPSSRSTWYDEAAQMHKMTLEFKVESISQSVLELLIGADKAAAALDMFSKAASKTNEEEA